VLWLKSFFWPMSNPLFQALASVDRACGHKGSSAIPPSASLYRERIVYSGRLSSPLSPTEFLTGRWRKADAYIIAGNRISSILVAYNKICPEARGLSLRSKYSRFTSWRCQFRCAVQ
jgi:hypothetical protein